MIRYFRNLAKKRLSLIIFGVILLAELMYYMGSYIPSYDTLHQGDAATYVYPELYTQIVLPRVPVYSWIISILKSVLSSEYLPTGIVIVQIVVYYISVIFFYELCNILVKNKSKVSLLCTLCYGCIPGLIWYNMSIRVESLSISLFVVYLWIIARVMVRKDSGFIINFLLGLFPAVLILLRPGFLFLLLLPVICLMIRYKERRKDVWKILVGGGICTLILFGWCYKNWKENQEFALTDISTYNQLVICFDTGLYIDNEDREFVEVWDKIQDPKKVYKILGEERCKRFIYNTYTEHILGVIKYNCKKLSKLGSTPLFIHGSKYVSERFLWKENIWGTMCLCMSQLFSFFNFSFLYAVIIFKLLKNIIRRNFEIYEIILWLCITLQFVTGFLGAQNEWSRMIVPVIPILIIWAGQLFEEREAN